MTRAHFVKSARKANPVAKRGESYYWWKFRRGAKQFSKTAPKPSRLTQSDFWSAVYSLQEDNAAGPSCMADVETLRDEIVSSLENIRDETQSKLENMPQGLQDGDTGQLLQERIDALEEAINEIQSVECSFEAPEPEGEDEENADAVGEADTNRASEIWGEIESALSNISCS